MKVERGDGKAADPRGNSAKVPTSLILQFVGRRIDVCMYVSDSVYSLLRVHHERPHPRVIDSTVVTKLIPIDLYICVNVQLILLNIIEIMELDRLIDS